MLATIDIPDAVYAELEARATREGITVEQLILRRVDAQSRSSAESRPRHRIQLPLLDSKEPGTFDLTNEQIYDIIPFP